MNARTVVLDSNPAPAAILAARSVLARNGIDPDDRRDVVHLATYGVSPLSVVTAAAQLAVTFDCPMACGRKLDPGSKDAMGVDLCPQCYDEAGLENEHADGHHDAAYPTPGCPACQDPA